MKHHLRLVFVTTLVSLAILSFAMVIIFQAAHFTFYNPAQAHSRYGISQSDLTIIHNGDLRYAWSLPAAGKALAIIRQPQFIVPLVYLPSLLLVIYEIRRLSRHAGRRNYQIT